MNESKTLEPTEPGGRPLWPRRVIMVVVPLHLAAFLALYYGAMRIIRGEILRTHAQDAQLVLRHEVDEFHPLMFSGPTDDASVHIEEFVEAHEVFQLSLYDAQGVPILGPGAENPEVGRFLQGDNREQYDWLREEGRMELNGIVRIVAEEECASCHEVGQTLGAATLSLDMTPQVTAAQARTSRHIAGLMGVWVVIVATINIAASRYARRSVARLESGVGADRTAPDQGVGKLLLDPVSAQLHESLQRVLEQQRQRDAQLSSRLHHTERLASLGQLTAGLAHEIKNPLAGIHGVLELLRDDSSDDATTKLYNEMLGELDRVNGTIHSLLNFARPAPPNRVPTDVVELIQGAVQLMRPGLRKRSIELELATSPDVTEFAVDPDQIRQVLVNLIGNAADAIDREGTVSVRATAFPDGSGLIIAVEDDGPGIVEAAIDRIFEPFFTTKFSGTGLGLAVVRRMVLEHGGQIEVESKPGEGTTFFVLLPAASEHDAHPVDSVE